MFLRTNRDSATQNGPETLRQQRPALTKTSSVETSMATERVCSIADCGKPVKSRGWCSAHVAKWRKYGDPLHCVKVATQFSVCAADGCEALGSSSRKGLCGRHYKRAWRYGSPNSGAAIRADRGEPLRWLVENAKHTSDHCLRWPFADRGNGYGAVTDLDGNLVGAHRLMCEIAHGPAPDGDSLAIHSCGKGHEGCVNPGHLSWGTVLENSADMIAHGTSARGTANAHSKLTESDVRSIRSLYPVFSQNELAAKFGVSQGTVWKILHRQAWSWLDPD